MGGDDDAAVIMEAVFTWACYLLAGASCFFSMLPTYVTWTRRALGPGGRRPDAMVAAFFNNAAWFSFGILQDSLEAAIINGIGGLFQMVNLLVYSALCTRPERLGLIPRFLLAGLFLGIAVFVGLHHDDDSVNLFKLMCTLFGFAGAVTPNIITVYMTQPRTVDILPHWAISLLCAVNGVAWVVRGFYMWNIPMAVQNGAGAVCAIWFLVLRYMWRNLPHNMYQPVPSDTDTEISDKSPGASETESEKKSRGTSDSESEENSPGASDSESEEKSPGASDSETEKSTGASESKSEKKSPGASESKSEKKSPGASDSETEKSTGASESESEKKPPRASDSETEKKSASAIKSDIRDSDNNSSTTDSVKTSIDAAPNETTPTTAPAARASASAAAEAEIIEDTKDIKDAETFDEGK